jgi:hypothetical protein
MALLEPVRVTDLPLDPANLLPELARWTFSGVGGLAG